MVLDTQDVAEYARSHARGLRLTFWLFKTDQVPAAQHTHLIPTACKHVCTSNHIFAAPFGTTNLLSV